MRRRSGGRGGKQAHKMLFFPTLELNKLGEMQRSGAKKYMDTSSTFLFEVVFKDMPVLGESQARPGSDRSIIVEVEPDRIVQKVFPHPAEDDRQFAKELAPQFAMQVVQKDLPHGFEPAYSVIEIERLPGKLHLSPPKFQGNRFRAWLI
jgi:hypothetical protein